MGLSGSDLAYKQARSGIARSGASRSNYFIPNVVLLIDDVDRTCDLDFANGVGLNVSLTLNDEPDTARFTLKSGASIPAAGETVEVSLGAAGNRVFGGQVVRRRVEYRESVSIEPLVSVECVDWLRLLNRRLITREFSSQSASDIAATILSDYTSGFTGTSIEAGLPDIEYVAFTNETPSNALRRIVSLMGGGGFYVDADRDLHLFGPSGDVSAKAPTPPLTLTTSETTLKAFTYQDDASQVRTRIFVEGQAARCPIDVPVGATDMPVNNVLPLFLHGAKTGRFGTNLLSWFSPYADSPESVLALTGVVGAQKSTVYTAASAGSATLDVAGFSGSFNFIGSGWIRVSGQYVRFVSVDLVSNGPTYYTFTLPTSGYGALPIDVEVGDLFEVADMISGIPASGDGALLYAQPAGTEVFLRTVRNDTGAQTTWAGIEGGDGIHEFPIHDPRLTSLGATDRGNADLATFKDALPSAEWVTQDMRPLPGGQQAISLGLSDTLVITSVDLSWFALDERPMRSCRAEPVRLSKFNQMGLTEQ